MKRAHHLRLMALVLVLASALLLLVGCIPHDKKWAKFRQLDSDEIYYFEVDSSNYFWYAEKKSYGEWVKGEERTLFTMEFTGGHHYDPPTDCILRFHDEYGSCMAELTLHMDTSTWHRTNYNSSRCKTASAPVIYMEEHRAHIEGLLEGIEFAGKRVEKIQKEVADHAPVKEEIMQFLRRGEAFPVYMCEEFGLWYENSHMTGKMLFDGEWKIVDLHAEDDDTLCVCPDGKYKGSEIAFYFVCQDENGFYLLDKATGKTGRLVETTIETDPRRDDPYFQFLLPIDRQGNRYKLVCQSLGLSFDTETRDGVWVSGTDSMPVYVEISYWGGLVVYEEKSAYNYLLYCRFVEMIDESTARFQVNEYEGIVPITEIILKKVPVEP